MNNAGKYCFENHGNVAEYMRKLRTNFGRRQAPSAPYVCCFVKKVKETGVLIDKPLLMSDLTDNSFYSSAERIWLCIRLNNLGKYCHITLKIMAKKSSFQMKLILILAGM